MPAAANSSRKLPRGFKAYWLQSSAGWMHLVAGGKGPPLFMLHGLGGSGEDFYDLVPHLASLRSCLLIDLPGFGRSARPEASYSVPWLLGRALEAADGLGLTRCDWLGHSMGGLLALLAAARHQGRVRRLVAVSPAGGQLYGRLDYRLWARLSLWNRDLPLRPPAWFIRRLVLNMFKEPGQPAARALAARMVSRYRGPGWPACMQAFMRAGRGILRHPIWPLTSALTAPTMLVWGNHDPVTPPAQMARIMRHLPAGARSRELDCGHLAPYEVPVQLAREVAAFLAGR